MYRFQEVWGTYTVAPCTVAMCLEQYRHELRFDLKHF